MPLSASSRKIAWMVERDLLELSNLESIPDEGDPSIVEPAATTPIDEETTSSGRYIHPFHDDWDDTWRGEAWRRATVTSGVEIHYHDPEVKEEVYKILHEASDRIAQVERSVRSRCTPPMTNL